MLETRNQPRSQTRARPTADPAPGATDVVEGATAEAAISAVHELLGPDAQIVEARRVLRGGIGGFFAKEVVQLHAAAGTSVPPGSAGGATLRAESASGSGFESESMSMSATRPSPEVARSPSLADRGAVSLSGPWGAVLRSEAGRTSEPPVQPATRSPVDRLLDQAAEVPERVDFATFLRQRLAEDETTTLPTSVDGAERWDDTVDRSSDPRLLDVADLPPAPAPTETLETMTWPSVDDRTEAAPCGHGTPMRPSVPASDPATVVASPSAAVLPPEGRSAEPLAAEPLAEPSPATDGGPPWSVAALLRLGLPVELVRSLEVAAPADDLAWTTALAEALRSSCRPLPVGPAVMLGPNAHLIGEIDGTPTARSETWLKALRGGRWLHLVVGGDNWRAPLADEPLAASWARPEDLPDALRCTVELGLVLGYGPVGGRIRRARPLDVALAVRDLVDGR